MPPALLLFAIILSDAPAHATARVRMPQVLCAGDLPASQCNRAKTHFAHTVLGIAQDDTLETMVAGLSQIILSPNSRPASFSSDGRTAFIPEGASVLETWRALSAASYGRKIDQRFAENIRFECHASIQSCVAVMRMIDSLGAELARAATNCHFVTSPLNPTFGCENMRRGLRFDITTGRNSIFQSPDRYTVVTLNERATRLEMIEYFRALR